MRIAARGSNLDRWRGNSQRFAAAACLAAVVLLVACSPGEVVQVEQRPAPTPAATAEATVAPVETTGPVATPVPEPSAQPQPTALSVPEPTAALEATAEPTGEPEPAAEPEPTAVPVATSAPAPTVPPAPAATVAPPPSSGSQAVLAANGAEVYTLNCARCHAESGLGTAQYSGLIGVGSKYSAAGLIAELTNGHPVTFGFADKLSADEIASVVAYVKATFP